MTRQAYPSVNGFQCSYADSQLTLDVPDGAQLTDLDISAYKWSRTVNQGVRKQGGVVTNVTVGDLDQDASITLSRESNDRLIRELAKVAPVQGGTKRLSLVRFSLLVQYTPVGSTAIFEYKLVGCRYLGDSDDAAEGSDPDEIEVPLGPTRIFNIIDGEEISL